VTQFGRWGSAVGLVFRENGNYKLPEAIGTDKLPERQINGSSYTNNNRKVVQEEGVELTTM